MSSGQGYIETQNPALMSLVVDKRSSRMDTTKMSGVEDGRATERYATFSEVYGPFREDFMELKEERAYQRGMMEHIRENMERINRLNTLPEPLLASGYQQRNNAFSSPVPEPLYLDGGMMEAYQETHPAQFHESIINTTRNYNDQDLADNYFSTQRPKPTYLELAKNTSRKPPPPQSRTYAELSMAPKNYSVTRARDAEEGQSVPSLGVTYLHRNPATPKFGISSMPSGWKANTLSKPEELWEQRSQGLGKFGGRNPRAYNRSLDLNTSRNPNMLGNNTLPLATVRLPALSNAQSMPSLHTADRNQGNTVDRNHGNDNARKLNIDINLNMVSPRREDAYGQNNYSSEIVHGNFYNSVPPLVLNPPVPFHSQSSVPIQYQSLSNRNSIEVNQQVMNGTEGTTIYPYRQMNNPWFPPQDELPTVRKNLRKGKYGNYRVFDIHDYKKLQKELRLGSLVGEEKDVETIQEKREKRAILQEYGRLVRAKNREEMRPPLPL